MIKIRISLSQDSDGGNSFGSVQSKKVNKYRLLDDIKSYKNQLKIWQYIGLCKTAKIE